jgi:hypothetical protein
MHQQPRSGRLRISPATAIALVALFFALGGSAFAVGERLESESAHAQRACGNGNVKGVAYVTGGPSGAANIPGNFSGARRFFASRFNCTGRAVQVRRTGIGTYEVRFVGNGAAAAVAGGPVGVQASADRIAPGVFRVAVYPAGRADGNDYPFVIALV